MIGLLLGGVVLLAPTQGQASHEPFGVYETWSNPTIRPDLWRGGEIFGGQEVQRVAEIGAISNDLLMSLRREGETSSNTGVNFSSNFLNVTNPLAVDQMEATFQVVSLTVTGCAANPAVSRARAARLLLARFNDGSSATPGDRTGDHLAGIQAQRSSDSTDPDGVIQPAGRLRGHQRR